MKTFTVRVRWGLVNGACHESLDVFAKNEREAKAKAIEILHDGYADGWTILSVTEYRMENDRSLYRGSDFS